MGTVGRQLITHFATPENMEKVTDKISSVIGKMRDNKKEVEQKEAYI